MEGSSAHLQILDLIQKMRTQQVNQAQQRLMQLVNSAQFMQTIFGIIKNQQLQNWVKTIASSFLNRVITQKLQVIGYKTMFSAIRNIMSSYEISPNDKRCFQRSLITLIEYIKQPQQIQEWLDFINVYINDNRLFDTGLLLISCSAIAEISNDYLCMIVQNTYENTFKKLNVNIQNSFGLNQLIKNWIVVFDKLRSINQDQYVDNIIKNMVKSNTAAKLLYEILKIQSPSQIWLCIKPQLYQLNLLKYQASQLLRKFSQQAHKIELTQYNCPLLNLIFQSYTTIKNTIAIVGTNFSILQNYQCQDFITSLFGLLIIYIKISPKLTKQQMQILIHIVCYPFLKTSEQQMNIFQQSPIEFNTLMEDLCDKQQYGILKTQAGRLLENIGDYCKQALESSVIFCVQCIKMKMGFIPTIENTDIKILDIQTAFQILSIHSFSLQKYQPQMEALKIIFLDKRLMQLSPLDISKIFLFLAYNYGQVFKNPIDGTIWIDFALKYNKHPSTRYIGLDFLSNISDQYFTQNFMNQFISLITLCEQRQSGQIWSIINKIFQHQKQNISQQLCLNLVNTIFARIQLQISKILTLKTKQSSLDIVNELHILRKIIQDQQYIHNKQQLINRIFNITIVFNQLVQLNIEDQIIKIVIAYVKLFKNNVPNQVYGLFNVILQQFKKTQYNQKQYFILFNHIIIKGEYIKIKQILRSLLTGLMYHLFDMTSKAQKLKQNISIANILTLLQNFIPIHGFLMKQEQNCFVQIQSICMRLFPSEGQKIYNKQLLAKALNLMLLCHIYSRSENTISYLFLYAKQNIFHKYDAYQVFSQSNIQIVIQYLNLMIDITNQQQTNCKKNIKTAKTAKGRLKIRRQQQLNKILQRIQSPFIDIQLKKKDKYPLKKQVQQCINKMKTQNIDTYKLIIMNMNQQRKTKLTTLLNQIAEVQGKNRIIRKVIGIKNVNNNQLSQTNNNNQQELQEEQDNDDNNFKRTRLMKKKKQNKKMKNNNIAEQ